MIGALLAFFLQAAAPATPAPSGEPPPAPSASTASEAPIDVTAQDRVRCRARVVTGRRIPARQCSTPREDAEQREMARRAMERIQEHMMTTMPRTADPP
jgi:hypothetical protein